MLKGLMNPRSGVEPHAAAAKPAGYVVRLSANFSEAEAENGVQDLAGQIPWCPPPGADQSRKSVDRASSQLRLAPACAVLAQVEPWTRREGVMGPRRLAVGGALCGTVVLAGWVAASLAGLGSLSIENTGAPIEDRREHP